MESRCIMDDMNSTEARVPDSPGAVFDYVVIGAGSAGSVVAGRLAEPRSGGVLVLEAGPADHAPAIHVPAGLMKLDPDKLYWRYEIEPDASRQGRRDLWAAARPCRLPHGQGRPEDEDRYAAEHQAAPARQALARGRTRGGAAIQRGLQRNLPAGGRHGHSSRSGAACATARPGPSLPRRCAGAG
jgi:choline dehydrogenase-like flavoprotein